MSPEKKASYHHGNLKTAMIEAGFRFLETDGLDKLSLRALAKAVGVSPTAAYNHFADKMALMVEMKAEGFRHFDTVLRDYLAKAPSDDPEAKVRALARAYTAFAFEHNSMFQLLFSWTPDPGYFTAELTESAACGETLLRETMVELLRDEGIDLDEYQQAVATFSSWALVHGVTMLLKSGVVDAVNICGQWPSQFSSQNQEALAQVLENLFTIQMQGLRHTVGHVEP